MPVIIKRENIRHKYFIVARDKRKILSKKKWGKDFNIKQAVSIFKSNKTFNINLKKTILKTKPYSEFVDTSEKPKKPRERPFRYFVNGLLKDGRTVSASSQTKLWNSVLEAKTIAEEKFLEQLAFTIRDVYDADEGLKLINEVRSIERGVIFNK